MKTSAFFYHLFLQSSDDGLFVRSDHRQGSSHAADQLNATQNIVVGFYLGDEAIPYRTTIRGKDVTLGQFKQLISKRGNYRYVLVCLLHLRL